MHNVFDIMDYGARADGITDCTAAIQRAIDEAAKVRGGVLVPPGEYLTGRLYGRACPYRGRAAGGIRI